MQMRASRIPGLVLAVAVAGILAATPIRANCLAPVPIYLGFSTEGYIGPCGDVPYVYYWEHHVGNQKNFGANVSTSGIWGNDSGAMCDALGSGILVPEMYTGIPQSYQSFWDWSNYGTDGCILLKLEPDVSCLTGTTPSLPVMDMVVASYGLGNPLQATAVVLSVDGDETNQGYIFDKAGAPSVDGDPCNGDAYSLAGPYPCGNIPVPAITSPAGCTADGCTFNVTVGSHGVTIWDDCLVANSKAFNCTGPSGDPRNLYAGRQVFVKRAPCDATGPGNIGSFDTRSFAMTWDGDTGSITRNFVPYAPQDLNLNGIQDGTEVAHVPLVLAGNDPVTVPIFIPKNAGATDCVYLGVGLLLDNYPDAAACGGPCDKVVTPLLSVNGIPIGLDTATPAADRVINLAASRITGEANVSWDTTAELSTAGFNLIGVRKSGGQVLLNTALIPALKGTTGESASYSINLGARDLKGSTAVYVELVKISGASELFGPAAF